MAEIGHSDNLRAFPRCIFLFFTYCLVNIADSSRSASAVERASACLRTSAGTHSGKAIRLDACAPLLVCSSQTFASWLFRNRGASLTKAGQSRR